MSSVAKRRATRGRAGTTSRGLPSWVGVLLAVVALVGVLRGWRATEPTSGLDFYQFWAVARSLDGAHGDVYSDAARASIGAERWREAQGSGSEKWLRVAAHRRVLETYSTPFLYTAFRAVAFDDYDAALQAYRVVLFLAMISSVVTLGRLLGHGVAVLAVALLVLLSLFEPFLSDVRVGNVNAIQLGLLALFLGIQRSSRGRAATVLAGAVLGLAVMFKPNLAAVLALVFAARLFDRRFRDLVHGVIGVAAGALTAFCASSLAFGTMRCWPAWTGAIASLRDDIITVPMGNFALSRLLQDLFHFDASFVLLGVFAAAALGALWVGRRRARRDETMPVALGCLVMLLSSRLAWLHYYVLAVPMVLVLLRPFRPGERLRTTDVLARRVVPLLAVLGLATNPIRVVVPSLGPRAVAAIVTLSGVLLYAAALYVIVDSRAVGSASSASAARV
jgi:Glycosyltransferase family 87